MYRFRYFLGIDILMKLSILIPYYNEIDTILKYDHMLFPIVEDIMREWGYDYEYVFYDDGSTDEGYRIIAGYELFYTSYPIKSYRDIENIGLGHAIHEGIKLCNGEYTIVMDADLSYRPANIRDMLMYLNKDIDCISSSPYQYPHLMKNGISIMRMWGSIIFNKMYSLAIGHKITCATSMFRLYRTSVLKEFGFKSMGFDINAEILSTLILSGKNVIEIPVMLYSRDYGISKMRVWYEFRRGIEMIFKILLKRFFNW
jgi:dolichol-phosphate mannosyltransferase